MNTLRLWWLFRRRARVDSRDPAQITGVLTVIAFAVTTAATLVVFGGLLAFWRRQEAGVTLGGYDAGVYVLLAVFAVMLLLVPITTLGGAAARLAMARRDARLAALRLAGATSAQVSVLTVLDAALQAVIGGIIGVAGYFALLPAVALLRFQDRTFTFDELWVGTPVLLGVFGAVMAIAVFSAASSLGRVSISPLGVSARQTPPALKLARVLVVVAAFAGLIVVNSMTGTGGAGMLIVVVLMGMIAAGMATMNVVGPLILMLIGRLAAARATSVTTLLAARRVADDPKTAWRCVGGVALATFLAGIASIPATLAVDAYEGAERIFVVDLGTGGLLALAIAGILAAVSTGVLQAGKIIDQRQDYRNLVMAGTDTRTLDRARLRETLIPLIAAMGTAIGVMLLFTAPVIGIGVFTQPAVLARFVLCVVAAGALVLAGSAAAGIVARRMVGTTAS